MPAVEGPMKAGGALLTIIPEVLGVFIFALVSLILAQIFFGADKATARLFFIDALSIVLIARLIVSTSRLLCAPEAAKLRLLPHHGSGRRAAAPQSGPGNPSSLPPHLFSFGFSGTWHLRSTVLSC